MVHRNSGSVEVHLRGSCALRCPVCDCRQQNDGHEALEAAIRTRADQIVLRGAAESHPELAGIAARAAAHGIEVVLRSHAIAMSDPRSAKRLADMGIRAFRAPVFAHLPAVHDRIAGRAGALVATLVGMRALAEAGLAPEIEVPLLPARLQNLLSVLELCRRATPSLRRVRLYVPARDVPAALRTPSWDVATPRLVALAARCHSEGVHIQLDTRDGVPFCALGEHEELWPLFHFNPRRRAPTNAGALFPDVCRKCRVRPQCAGVSPAYAAANGERGLRAFPGRPKELYRQRTTPVAAWDRERRRAAASRRMKVVRPTVHCNQDCPFCSANETSSSVWTAPDVMLRKIARVARTGVTQLSFSGGEPLLSPHLAAFVQTARRTGIEEIELVTNGTLLTQRRVDELVSAGLQLAFVSLHAHTESLSQTQTRKVGDWQRTVDGIERLLVAGVRVLINHVINARNFRFLGRFVEVVHERFRGRAPISFAYMTPQYQALEHPELLVRISDAMPYLRAALHRAVELEQPFVVGSRQGIPPCFLREFQAWSDIFRVASEAATEDAHQKQRSGACDECRYGHLCTGLWRPYVERFGLDEIVPVAGERLDPASFGFGMTDAAYGFDDVSPELRDVEAEQEYRALALVDAPVVPEPADGGLGRSRPLRLHLAGTGQRARLLAHGILRRSDMVLASVSSPHATDGDLAEFGHAPAFRDTALAMDDLRPEAVVIASSTRSHLEIIEAAVQRGIPMLIEKPLVDGEEERSALAALAGSAAAPMVPAHQVLFATGMDAVALPEEARDARVSYVQSVERGSGDALRTWSPEPLYEFLYHVLVRVGRSAGGGVAEVRGAAVSGEARPETIAFELAYPRATAQVRLQFGGVTAESEIQVETAGGSAKWTRRGRKTLIERNGRVEEPESRGGEIERMLDAFADALLGRTPPGLPTVAEALDVMTNAEGVVQALAEVDRRFSGHKAVRHTASRRFRGALP